MEGRRARHARCEATLSNAAEIDESDASLSTVRRVPGEPGIWILLFGDLALFTVLFSVYLMQRGKEPDCSRNPRARFT
jgi:heme/copper-type cytochrome/quinol oxidase subunit 3